jgi:outer membrane receptor protein involved in Fe transport
VLTTLQPLFGALPLVNGLDANGQGINAATIGIHPEDASERALFGETNFDLFSNLRLTGGARLYRAEVSGKIMSTGAAVQENGFSGAVTNEGFSPKAAITFRPFNQVMLYANVSRGFQFGGFNQVTIELPTDNIPPTYKSSTLWNYETGIRTDWFHKTLRFDATVFFLNWKNAQVSQVTSDQQSVYVDNVGVVHSKGVEGTLSYLTPIRGLSIQEDASYIEAKTAVQFEDSEGNEIPVGTLMPSSPKLQETTSLNYKLLLGPWTTTTSIVNTFQGKAYDDIAHDHTVGNYNRMNIYFNVGRNDLSFHPVLTFSATNVFDRRAIVSELGQPAAIAESPTLSNFLEPIPTVYNRPLTFSIRLSMQY